MYNFCTYFDHNYILQGLALHRSLLRQCEDFQLHVLCLSRQCYEILNALSLPKMILITLEEFEDGDEELLESKRNRSIVEYYFTCTPSLILYILKDNPLVEMITYLDADLFFYENPKPIYDEMFDQSIGIIEHRYPKHYKAMEIYGVYNVGWLSFSQDGNSINCLNWWRNQCIAWCYKRVEPGRFADQKYLDEWVGLFEKVKIIQHKGANLATWNIENYKVTLVNNKVWIDSDKLLFFHFHGLRRLTSRFYSVGYHQTRIDRIIRENIYRPYLRALRDIHLELTEGNLWSPGDVFFSKQYRHKNGKPKMIITYLSLLHRIFLSGNYIAIDL